MWGKKKMRIWGQSRVYGMCLSLFIHLIVPAAKKLIETWNIDAWKNPTEALVKQTSRTWCDGSVSNFNSRSKSGVTAVWNVSEWVSAEGSLRGPLGCLDAVYLFALEGPHFPESTSWERALASKGTLWQKMFAHKSPWDCVRCHWAQVSQSQVKEPVCMLIPHGDAIRQTCTAKLDYTSMSPSFAGCTDQTG